MGKYVYIAGPYTQGDVGQNVWFAIHTAEILRQRGFVPFVPHLYHFWHVAKPHEWQFWVDLDLSWLPKCDFVYRLPGQSEGAEVEIRRATELNIPVFYTLEELFDACKA